MTKILGIKKLQGLTIRTKYSLLPSDFTSWKMGLEFTEDNPSKILINSGAVEAVYDQSGTGRDFSQGTASSRPAFTDGLGATFDGVNDFLFSTSLITDSVGTLVYVLRWNLLGGDEQVLSIGNTAIPDGNAWSFKKNTSDIKFTVHNVSSSQGQTGSIAVSNTTDFIVHVHQRLNMYHNTNKEDVTLRGAGAANLWFDNAVTPDQMRIGRLTGSSTSQAAFGNFTIKAMHYFNTELSDNEIVRLVNGLKALYGI